MNSDRLSSMTTNTSMVIVDDEDLFSTGTGGPSTTTTSGFDNDQMVDLSGAANPQAVLLEEDYVNQLSPVENPDIPDNSTAMVFVDGIDGPTEEDNSEPGAATPKSTPTSGLATVDPNEEKPAQPHSWGGRTDSWGDEPEDPHAEMVSFGEVNLKETPFTSFQQQAGRSNVERRQLERDLEKVHGAEKRRRATVESFADEAQNLREGLGVEQYSKWAAKRFKNSDLAEAVTRVLNQRESDLSIDPQVRRRDEFSAHASMITSTSTVEDQPMGDAGGLLVELKEKVPVDLSLHKHPVGCEFYEGGVKWEKRVFERTPEQPDEGRFTKVKIQGRTFTARDSDGVIASSGVLGEKEERELVSRNVGEVEPKWRAPLCAHSQLSQFSFGVPIRWAGYGMDRESWAQVTLVAGKFLPGALQQKGTEVTEESPTGYSCWLAPGHPAVTPINPDATKKQIMRYSRALQIVLGRGIPTDIFPMFKLAVEIGAQGLHFVQCYEKNGKIRKNDLVRLYRKDTTREPNGYFSDVTSCEQEENGLDLFDHKNTIESVFDVVPFDFDNSNWNKSGLKDLDQPRLPVQVIDLMPMVAEMVLEGGDECQEKLKIPIYKLGMSPLPLAFFGGRNMDRKVAEAQLWKEKKEWNEAKTCGGENMPVLVCDLYGRLGPTWDYNSRPINGIDLLRGKEGGHVEASYFHRPSQRILDVKRFSRGSYQLHTGQTRPGINDILAEGNIFERGHKDGYCSLQDLGMAWFRLKFDCPYSREVLGCWNDDDGIFVALESCRGGTLEELLLRNEEQDRAGPVSDELKPPHLTHNRRLCDEWSTMRGLNEHACRIIFAQVLISIEHLQAHGLMHRNIHAGVIKFKETGPLEEAVRLDGFAWACPTHHLDPYYCSPIANEWFNQPGEHGSFGQPKEVIQADEEAQRSYSVKDQSDVYQTAAWWIASRLGRKPWGPHLEHFPEGRGEIPPEAVGTDLKGYIGRLRDYLWMQHAMEPPAFEDEELEILQWMLSPAGNRPRPAQVLQHEYFKHTVEEGSGWDDLQEAGRRFHMKSSDAHDLRLDNHNGKPLRPGLKTASREAFRYGPFTYVEASPVSELRWSSMVSNKFPVGNSNLALYN